MKINLEISGKTYSADLSMPIDISIPMRHGAQNPNAFHAPPVDIDPVRMGDWVGSLEAGSSVNFKNIKLNPHGNGTHTESCAHISQKGRSINQTLQSFHFPARLISILPTRLENGEKVIEEESLEGIELVGVEALIVRSLPNDEDKLSRNYSGTNPVYFSEGFLRAICNAGIMHFLTDLPSVDREEDGGALAAHKAFWQIPDSPRLQATITEMVFIPEEVKDGLYLMNLQICSLENDASPSKPVLYALN